MTIDYAYQYLQFIARKNQIAQLKPNEVQFAINKAIRDYYEFLIGHVETFRYNDATPKVGLGMSSRISSDLSPFKINNYSIPVTLGLATYPTDFDYLALMVDTNGKKVEWISDEKIPARLNDPIDNYADTGKSFYNEGATGWYIYGAATQILVNYYRKPKSVVWGYTVVGGRPVYNPSTSVDPEFNDNAMEEVLSRAAGILGFSFEKQSLIQLREGAIQRGE